VTRYLVPIVLVLWGARVTVGCEWTPVWVTLVLLAAVVQVLCSAKHYQRTRR
jgi:general stress protein CsbA